MSIQSEHQVILKIFIPSLWHIFTTIANTKSVGKSLSQLLFVSATESQALHFIVQQVYNNYEFSRKDNLSKQVLVIWV